MSAIAAYRTAILALLDDAALTRYTNNQVDQALRMALSDYSKARPYLDSLELSTDGNQKLSLPSDLNIFEITRVELWNDVPNLVMEIPYHAEMSEGQWSVTTGASTYASGNTLTITYSSLHYIDGLDGAAGTSVPDIDEEIVEMGAAGYAVQMRSSSRAETINMQPQVSAQLATVAELLLARFKQSLLSHSGAVFADPFMRIAVPYNFLKTRPDDER
jgi:hypothetical protein